MKKNKVIRLLSIMLILTMATTSVVGGTLARYTTTVSGTDSVRVAQFGYKATDGTISYTTDTAAAIDIFEDLKTDATGTIADTNGLIYLAPGVYGSFEIVLDGTDSDVDIEMLGSTVVAASNTSTIYLDPASDEFLSYAITYAAYSDTNTSTDDDIEDYIAATALSTTTYQVSRATASEFASDLESILDDIILEKNTMGVISIQYAWVDTSAVTDTGNSGETEDGNYDAEDTALGQKWSGTAGVPSLTLTITNVASQVVNTTGVTDNGDIVYTTAVLYNSSSSGSSGDSGLYTVDGSKSTTTTSST